MSLSLPALPSGPLVSTDWLAAHLDAANARALRVVDIRGKVLPATAPSPRYLSKRAEYDAAHIPGAVFVDWTRDIVDLDDPVPVQIAKPDIFQRKMQELGIGDDTSVIVYDDYNTMFAGRMAWALRYFGHDRVRILDGGLALWLAEGRATTAASPRAADPVTFTPRARPLLRRTADQVEAALGNADTLLVDARPPGQFVGNASAASRAGHIPGAKNVHYSRLVDPATGKLLPRERLKEVFASAGVDVDNLPRDVVAYCNGGVSASVPITALAILGRTDVALYDGSWNEWGNDPTRVIASADAAPNKASG